MTNIVDIIRQYDSLMYVCMYVCMGALRLFFQYQRKQKGGGSYLIASTLSEKERRKFNNFLFSFGGDCYE